MLKIRDTQMAALNSGFQTQRLERFCSQLQEQHPDLDPADIKKQVHESAGLARKHGIKSLANVERFIRLTFDLQGKSPAATILNWEAHEDMKMAALEKRAQEEALKDGE